MVDPNDQIVIAAYVGKVDEVRSAMDNGADIHVMSDAALGAAAMKGHVDVVRALIAAGANIHADNEAALALAVIYDHADVVRLLLHAGANVVAVWMAMETHYKNSAAATLDACSDAMSPKQRAALARESEYFIGLCPPLRSASRRKRLMR